MQRRNQRVQKKRRARQQISRASKRACDQGDRAASIDCWQGGVGNTEDVNGMSNTSTKLRPHGVANLLENLYTKGKEKEQKEVYAGETVL